MRKYIMFVAAAAILGCLASCSQSGPKEAEHCFVKSSEFSSGMLAKYIEASTADLNLVESPSEPLMLEMTIRRKDNAPKDFEGVDPQDISFTKLLSVAIVTIEDRDGVKLAELQLKPEDALILKKFVTGEETIEDVHFVGNSEKPDEVIKRCYNVVPYLTADIESRSGNKPSSLSSDYSSSEEKDDEEESFISSSDSEDWDELLESYEEYVDKYISYLKKASKGDMDALSEYPALLEKAQKFTDKMKNAEEQMSASQWAKYNEITQKMLKAAQEMNE
jgi:hypothetical protein